jgi:AcrR family transcriptional regulator
MDIATDLLSPSERDRVLRAMSALCAEQGYEETTVSEVVSRAGVTPEAFAEMFSGKEECTVAALNAIIGEVVSAVAISYSADRSEWESGLRGMKAILELMAAHPSFAQLGYIVARQMAPSATRDTYEGIAGVLRAMLGRLRENTGSKAPPSAARAALGGPEAVVRREIMAGRLEQLPRLLPDIAYAATVAFLGQEDALQLSRLARELLKGTEWE